MNCRRSHHSMAHAARALLSLCALALWLPAFAAGTRPDTEGGRLEYNVSFPHPESHAYHVLLRASGWNADTLRFKMPNWEPGYYQIMDYAKSVKNFAATDDEGRPLPFTQTADNAWDVSGVAGETFELSYDVQTTRQFVANSYVDEAHAYLIPGNSFLYVDGFIDTPVSVELDPRPEWTSVATGLQVSPDNPWQFGGADFDILYDSPILVGELDSLPSFFVGGVEHRFIGYKLGDFDAAAFMDKLRRAVEASVAIIGDIPYRQYTFIGIGPGQGGIEHLNNATVSFDGNTLSDPAAADKALLFLTHEYFHNYNVKRIRPFELGPFDYDHGSRTNLLWVSEGLTVYYDILAVARAGLMDRETLLSRFAGQITNLENSPGRHYQSLHQASYNTWKDGPFATQGEDPDKAISYYVKGPVVGLLLDFAIRHASGNSRSLDDVMRLLYRKYYQQAGRGFTDAEFQEACETVAGAPLTEIFEYVYTTRDLDYAKYLAYGGLETQAETVPGEDAPSTKISLHVVENPDAMQLAVLGSWSGSE